MQRLLHNTSLRLTDLQFQFIKYISMSIGFTGNIYLICSYKILTIAFFSFYRQSIISVFTVTIYTTRVQ